MEMDMREEDAKKKWCPEARFIPDGFESAVNRTGEGVPAKARCLGSNCVMWQEYELYTDGKREHGNGDCGLKYPFQTIKY